MAAKRMRRETKNREGDGDDDTIGEHKNEREREISKKGHNRFCFVW